LTDPVVIIGAGQAGVQLCLTLRKCKYDGPVIMYSAESTAPYHRPPLSKDFLLDKIGEEKLSMRPNSFYQSKSIDLRLGCEVKSVDLEAGQVHSNDGSQSYSKLVFATGACPRQLPLEGMDRSGVYCLRSLDDSRIIKSELPAIESLVVVGAGFIGLEVAAAARGLGKRVTIFDTADRVMARAVAPAISQWFQQMHIAAGADIRLGEAIAGITGDADGRVSHVTCANGQQLDAQMVVVGVGVTAETTVAEGAGLQCDDGIVVNEFCRTSNADVFAVGDCASHPNPYASVDRLRLESIQNATDQARVVGSNIAALIGEESTHSPTPAVPGQTVYNSVPWFWSDQGAHSLQMAGLSFNADKYVLRGELASDSFSVYHFQRDKLVAVDSVNMPRDHMLARKLIASGISLTPAQAEDMTFDIKTLTTGARQK